MTEEFKCPEFKTMFSGKGFYQKVESHPKEDYLKKCAKDNSLYNQD